jgi:acyl-CoA-binding protein
MDLKKYIPYAIGLIIIYILYKQFTGAKAKVKLVDNLDIFNYQKWIETKKKYPKAIQLSSSEIIALVDRIYNAKGYFNDDENAVYTVFQTIPYQSVVGQLSVAFQNKYNVSLINYLSFLNDKEKARIFDYVKKMKRGY